MGGEAGVLSDPQDVSGPKLTWFKGNLHAHTDRSDGRLPPGALADWYASRRYDFLAITDHGRVTRLSPRANGMLLLPGAEVTAWDERAQSFHHLLALLDPASLDSVSSLKLGPPQHIVDQLIAGGAAVFSAHPYWLGLSSAETGALRGTLGIEVYNHLCHLERARGYSEQQWDELLAAGKRMWGIAVDDCHWREPDGGGGWVMVRAPELTPTAILSSLRSGDFYSTQGPEITRFAVDGDRSLPAGAEGAAEAVFECSPCASIVFYADRWLGAVVAPDERGGGRPLVAGRYRLTGKETYVRAMCVDGEGRKAWTNPIMLPPLGEADRRQPRVV